jgi:hypothetical protein
MRVPSIVTVHLGLLGLLLGVSVGVGACFIEPAEPANFRFECGSSSECQTGQVCASGLCQQACGQDEQVECPRSAPVCLNGYCASVCSLADDVCPSPQSCLALTLEQPAESEEAVESGLCSIPCSEAAPCADGLLCFEELGVCVQTCTTTDECGSGEACLEGFCIPGDSGGGGFP